jgi:hypothetical protein
MMTDHLSHDIPDVVPAWYRPQPNSPHQVYGSKTIQDIQRTLSCPESGVMDANTITHIKGLQYAMGILADGRINEDTAIAIQRLRDRYQMSTTPSSESTL